jgi:subtilisin family serine protease
MVPLMRKFLVLIAALLVAVPAAVSSASGPPASGRYIVTFAPGTDAHVAAASLARSGASVSHVYTSVFAGAAVELPVAAAAALERRPDVARVEVDAVVSVADTQTSPPWGLDRIDQRSRPLSSTFVYTATGAGVTVYVVDTGVLSTHNDFAGRMAAGYTAVADGRGTTDCNGHGTHVAGTAAGTTYGVAKHATVVPVRVLDCAGSGYASWLIAGLDWIVAHHQDGVPAVANLSLGFGGGVTSADDAVRRVISDGVTTVVAAGNSNANACNYSPARVEPAMTVGATTSSDARASYSNYGKCVDLFAPGSSVLSAWHTSTSATNTISGTSMASPHVAGAAAALLSVAPTLTPAAVSSHLTATATTGVLSSIGSGSPNLLLWADPAGSFTPVEVSAPDAPTSVTARAGKRSASVSWVQGASNGAALTGQTVWVYEAGTKVGSVAVSASATSVSIGGLKAGVKYRFSVTATNSAGTSAESALSNEVTPKR